MTGLPPPLPPRPLPPPVPTPSAAQPERRKFPLWAKIAVPVGGLLLLSGVASALQQDEPAAVRPAADLGSTSSVADAAPTATPTTAAVPTSPPTSVAPTLPPTQPPTLPPTTRPATTPAPTAPPPPMTVAPAPPLPVVDLGTDPQFDTCKAAKANGYGPYYAGQDPEYDWYRDADSDGIVCE